MSLSEPAWRVKRTPCPFYAKGNCVFSNRCNFIHVLQEEDETTLVEPEPEVPLPKKPKPSFNRSAQVAPTTRMSDLLRELKSVIGEEPAQSDALETHGPPGLASESRHTSLHPSSEPDPPHTLSPTSISDAHIHDSNDPPTTHSDQSPPMPFVQDSTESHAVYVHPGFHSYSYSDSSGLLSPVTLPDLQLKSFVRDYNDDDAGSEVSYATWATPGPLALSPPRSPALTSTFDLLSSPFGSPSSRIMSPHLAAFLHRIHPLSPPASALHREHEEFEPPDLSLDDLDSPENYRTSSHTVQPASRNLDNDDDVFGSQKSNTRPVELEKALATTEDASGPTSRWDSVGQHIAVYVGGTTSQEVQEAIHRENPTNFLDSPPQEFDASEALSSSSRHEDFEDDVDDDDGFTDQSPTAQLAYLDRSLPGQDDTLNSLYDAYSDLDSPEMAAHSDIESSSDSVSSESGFAGPPPIMTPHSTLRRSNVFTPPPPNSARQSIASIQSRPSLSSPSRYRAWSSPFTSQKTSEQQSPISVTRSPESESPLDTPPSAPSSPHRSSLDSPSTHHVWSSPFAPQQTIQGSSPVSFTRRQISESPKASPKSAPSVPSSAHHSSFDSPHSRVWSRPFTPQNTSERQSRVSDGPSQKSGSRADSPASVFAHRTSLDSPGRSRKSGSTADSPVSAPFSARRTPSDSPGRSQKFGSRTKSPVSAPFSAHRTSLDSPSHHRVQSSPSTTNERASPIFVRQRQSQKVQSPVASLVSVPSSAHSQVSRDSQDALATPPSSKVPFGFRKSFVFGGARTSSSTLNQAPRSLTEEHPPPQEDPAPPTTAPMASKAASRGLKPLRLSTILTSNPIASASASPSRSSFISHSGSGNRSSANVSSQFTSSNKALLSHLPHIQEDHFNYTPPHTATPELTDTDRASRRSSHFKPPMSAPLDRPNSWARSPLRTSSDPHRLSNLVDEDAEGQLYAATNDYTIRRSIPVHSPPKHPSLDVLPPRPLSCLATTPKPALMFAIASDDVEQVRQVLASGDAGPNDAMGPQSALAFTLTNDQLSQKLDIVKVLLEYGADITTLQKELGSPEGELKPILEEMDDATKYYLSKADTSLTRRASALMRRSSFKPLARIRYGIVGQDRALEQLFRVLSMHNQKITVTPIVMLLCGPSGHGKSMLAHKFGSLLDVPTHTVNMTTLRSAHDLWQSYSISPDQSSAGPPCTLIEFLINNEGKRCVVVLDEIEKTKDDSVLWSLLLPWELGRCSFEANSMNVDVRNVVWLGTSNIGHDLVFEYHDSLKHPNQTMSREEYVELMAQLRPRVSDRLGASVLSRVTTILPFVPFTLEETRVIASEALQSISTDLTSGISKAALNTVIEGALREFIPAEGARSLYRAVSNLLVDAIDLS